MQMQQSLEKHRPIVRPLRKYFACSRLLLVTSQASASVTTVPHMANGHPCVCVRVCVDGKVLDKLKIPFDRWIGAGPKGSQPNNDPSRRFSCKCMAAAAATGKQRLLWISHLGDV